MPLYSHGMATIKNKEENKKEREEDVEQLVLSYSAGGNINCYNHFGKLWQY